MKVEWEYLEGSDNLHIWYLQINGEKQELYSITTRYYGENCFLQYANGESYDDDAVNDLSLAKYELIQKWCKENVG